VKYALLALVVGVAVALGGAFVYWRATETPPVQPLTEGVAAVARSGEAVEEEAAATSPSPSARSRPIVRLEANKLAASGIGLGEVVRRDIQTTQVVPGRLRYDERRHVDLRVPAAGVVSEIRVTPGQAVDAEEIVAVLSSAEVGSARADVLRRQAELRLVEAVSSRKQAIRTGIAELVAAIEAGREPEAINASLAEKELGSYRADLLAAYTRERVAASLSKRAASLGESGALAGKTVKQRLGERGAATAALRTAIELAEYESDREATAAAVAVEDAERRLAISRQHLQTLLGAMPAGPIDRSNAALSRVEIRAPFAGTIEANLVAAHERLPAGESVVVMADTRQLWVAAEIRERQWRALQLEPGAELSATTPALPGESLTAVVHFLGREVTPTTNAVPLIATIDNGEGLLRPGQFMQVELPLGETRSVVAVPEDAVMEHDGQPFVFLAIDGGYRRVDVVLGEEEGEWIEVKAGLQAGDQVVRQGAFYLKSELLLEGEDP